MKRCTTCENTFLIEAFNRGGGTDGYSSSCRKCSREFGERYRRQNTKFIREMKDVPCTDCDERYPPHVMDFDHIGDDKKFSIGSATSRTLRDIVEEIAKCEVVCANCHRERTFQRGHAVRKGVEEMKPVMQQQDELFEHSERE